MTDWVFERPVDGVTATPGPPAKAMDASTTRASEVVPIATKHSESVALVPQVPSPMVPVIALNVMVKVPLDVTVMGSLAEVSHPATPLDCPLHSTATSEAPGVNPLPERLIT